jgi:hypothetical protein
MRQQVVFDVIATPNPENQPYTVHFVVNPTSGIGVDQLKQIVEERIPLPYAEESGDVLVTKRIIRIDRIECQCCNTALMALVAVSRKDRPLARRDETEELYRIVIEPQRIDHLQKGDSTVTVEKLFGSTIYEGRAPYLPQRDYDAKSAAQEE